MFKRIIAMAIVIATIVSETAQAQVCANCATKYTQLLNYAQLLNQLAKQASILETNLNQYKNMTTNTTPLTSLQWGNAQADLNSVNQLLGKATSLSFAAGNLDGQFSQKYPNYNSYLSGQLTPSNMAGKYQQWSTDTQSSVKTTLQGANQQWSQIQGSEQGLIQNLQSQATGVQGNLQALQVNAEIGLQNLQQIQKLRQLMLMHINLMAQFIQTQDDKKTADQAAWNKFIGKP